MHSNHEEQELQLQTLHSSFTSLEACMGTIDHCLKEFDKRFSIIYPIIHDVRQTSCIDDSTATEW